MRTHKFPEDKKAIAKLSLEDKMVWYLMQDPREMVFLGNSPEFQVFWRWHVVIPMKIKRFYYRVKNFEIFKHYSHISELRPKR